MDPLEKAKTALNTRIVRLQTTLRETHAEATQRFLVQAILVCTGIGDALSDYVKMIGQFAQARHAGLKQQHETLTVRHAELLESGNELLERLKAAPGNRAIRKEIEGLQREMETIQKTLRRGANTLQRDVAPSMAMIEKLALSIRRFSEAEQLDALKRVCKMIIAQVDELYRAQPNLESKNLIAPKPWEESALAGIDQAKDFHEAYAHSGYQVVLAIDTMTLALSENPPRTAAEAVERAEEAANARLKAITARFSGS